MLSGGAISAAAGRRTRVPCRYCGRPVEIARMRAHLREAHQLMSSELETSLLDARRAARRAGRTVRRG
ncbi:MAG TPA: hypothetical protein VMH78_08835 [Thermoplasmata archaeon]|nr:hypothetical protein [Thermoplasmata archaeon]